jgi:FkbM family methyltransferase
VSERPSLPRRLRARGWRLRARTAAAVQQGFRRAGYELRPYRGLSLNDEDIRRVKLLGSAGIELVLDVGANAGQYAERLRAAGYSGRIVSFEPLAEAFATLERAAAADPSWEARHLALSDADGDAEIHVSANSWSSSLLAMGERHLASAPESAYVRTERVTAAQLDSIWDEVVGRGARPFLKLDVQGLEMRVLRGATSHLHQLEGVQAELSLVHLYEGDSLWRDVVDYLEARDFELAGLEPGFEDPKTGRMLQADGIFLRRR